MSLTAERIEQKLRERFPGAAIERQEGVAVCDHTLYVPAESLVEMCLFLRDDDELQFAMLSWMGGADYMPRVPRFETIYSLLSLTHNQRFTLKVRVGEENLKLPSVVSVWPTANWHERETYDFYGLEFVGHPDMTRILLPEDWVGWPLRKDSPLGYEEVAFTHNTPNRLLPSPALKKLAPKKVKYRAQ